MGVGSDFALADEVAEDPKDHEEDHQDSHGPPPVGLYVEAKSVISGLQQGYQFDSGETHVDLVRKSFSLTSCMALVIWCLASTHGQNPSPAATGILHLPVEVSLPLVCPASSMKITS